MNEQRWAGRASALGVFLLVVAGPLYLFAVRTTHTTDLRSIRWLSPAPMAADPALGSEALFAELVRSGVYLLVAVVANVTLVGVLVGALLSLYGAAFFTQRYISELYRVLFKSPITPVLWGFIAFVFLFAASGTFRRATVEVTSVLFAAGSVFCLSGVVLLWAEGRANRALRILVIGPAVLSSVFLSVVAGMFASPFFSDLMVRITDEFVAFMLLDVFAPLGLNRPLTALFDLEGVAYFLVWVSLTVAVGWVFGAALVRYDISLRDHAYRRLPESMHARN